MKYLSFIGLSLLAANMATAGTQGAVQPTHPFYINAGIGAVFSSTSTSNTSDSNQVLFSPTSIGTSLFTLPDMNWRNRFKNGADFNLAAGYYYNPNWHADVEFIYQNIERISFGSYGWREQNSSTGAIYAQQSNNPISANSIRAHLYSLMTNGTYDFNNSSAWTPFVGAGFGIAWLRSGSVQTNNTLNIDDPATPLIETAPVIQNSPSLSGTAFAWQFKAGVQYQLTDTLSAILQYRLLNTTDFKGSQSTIVTNPNTAGQTIFYTGQHDIKGLLTHGAELVLRFNV